MFVRHDTNQRPDMQSPQSVGQKGTSRRQARRTGDLVGQTWRLFLSILTCGQYICRLVAFLRMAAAACSVFNLAAAMIALSRICLNNHYPSDVLIGAGIGLWYSFLALTILTRVT